MIAAVDPVCLVCGGRIYAKGFCRSHYERWRRSTRRPVDGSCIVQTCARDATFDDGYCDHHAERRQKAWKLRDAVTDLLAVDGGWLTADGIAVDLGANAEAVAKVLRVLRDDGTVVSRPVAVTHSMRYVEWRTA